MIIIPGEVIAVLTFPGVVMHEISHRLMCDFFKIPVYEISYFNKGSRRAGYVIHERTSSLTKSLLIGIAPLFINSILCMILTFPFNLPVWITGQSIPTLFNIVLWWTGISMGANAFPSDQDVANVFALAQEGSRSVGSLKAISAICFIVRFLNHLSQAWLDFIYAFLISLILPYLIFG